MTQLEAFWQQTEPTDPVVLSRQHTLRQQLGQLAQELADTGDLVQARRAWMEQEVLASSKNVEKGEVGWMVQGTNADGSPFEWPDTRAYGDAEYDYLRARFRTTTNLYLKTQYGLFLSLRRQMRQRADVAALVEAHFALSQAFFAAGEPADGERNHAALFAIDTLVVAFRLGYANRKLSEVAGTLRRIQEYLIETQRTWDIQRRATLRLMARFTELLVQYWPVFSPLVALEAWFDRLRTTIAAFAAEGRHEAAVDLAEISRHLAAKSKSPVVPWLALKAEQYEAQSHTRETDLAGIHFAEQALRLYREIGDTAGETRMAARYEVLRGQQVFGQVRTPLPPEYVQSQLAAIEVAVREQSSEALLALVADTPMFTPVPQIREMADQYTGDFFSRLPAAIVDSTGNTVKRYDSPDEVQQYQFWKVYGLWAQPSTQFLVELYIQAHAAGKLTAEGVLAYIGTGWIGETRSVQANARWHDVQPLRLVASGIRILIRELDQWRDSPTYEPDFIATTDSLVLKTEYFLRYCCTKLGIPTFRTRPDGTVMEKLLDELMRDLQPHLDPEDWHFFQYVLIEKAGRNLRNQIAHGLLDDVAYGPESAFLVLTILLKLARYAFTPTLPDGQQA